MKKLNLLFLIFTLSTISCTLSSKTMLLKCDAFIFKIIEPIIGFKKAYMIKESKWVKIKEFEVIESSYMLKNIYPNQTKCNNDKCRVNIELEKSLKETSYLSYKSIVSNKFCSIDGGNKCYIRKTGKNMEKGYCSKITTQDVSFENN